jgi:hypothetical protein
MKIPMLITTQHEKGPLPELGKANYIINPRSISMNEKILSILVVALAIPFTLQAVNTGFLEGAAQEVIVKVRTADGKVKWYQVKPEGSRSEMEMKPGDRFEFLYKDSVDLNAVTVKPGKK